MKKNYYETDVYEEQQPVEKKSGVGSKLIKGAGIILALLGASAKISDGYTTNNVDKLDRRLRNGK